MSETQHPLAKPVWSSLVGPHKHLAAPGLSLAKRYVGAVAPFAAVIDESERSLSALEEIVSAGEQIYLLGTELKNQKAWELKSNISVPQMIYEGRSSQLAPYHDFVKLEHSHVPQMLALTALVFPGYFRERTIEMGNYYGAFENGQLIAMAGERMAANSDEQVTEYREISAVCTHPDFQGRGLASKLVSLLLRQELERGEKPFLHVGGQNKVAIAVYERLGFKIQRAFDVRLYQKL